MWIDNPRQDFWARFRAAIAKRATKAVERKTGHSES